MTATAVAAFVTTSDPGLPGRAGVRPRQGTGDEDDGYVLTVVYDGPRDASFLAILDARSMVELAKLHLRHRIPAGFLGSWADGVA